MSARVPTLFCARCDEPVAEGAAECTNRYGRGAHSTFCGCRAFYRTGAKPQRSIMGPPLPDEPSAETAPPAPARRRVRGFRGWASES